MHSDLIQRLLTAPGSKHLVPMRGEIALERAQNFYFVVNNQNACTTFTHGTLAKPFFSVLEPLCATTLT
jgi:hypothetical protein